MTLKNIISPALWVRISFVLTVVLSIITPGLLSNETSIAAEPGVRPSILAGSWYPRETDILSASIKQFIDQAKPPDISGHLIALAVPHAGHIYSGPVAGYGYKLLAQKDFDTLVLVGPSHRDSFSGVSVNLQDYQTPLGVVKVNRGLAQKIIETGGPSFTTRPQAHSQEHCLEIQLPFIQTINKDAKIVPVIMGDQDIDTCRRLAGILAGVLKDQKAILIASTDLSHFHPSEEARKLDQRLAGRVAAFDPEALHQDLAAGKIEACGGGPLTVVMMAAKMLGADKAVTLKYAHSGDASGDNSRVVGYLAAAFIKTDADGNPAGLSPDDQKRLLHIARQSIIMTLNDQHYEIPKDLPQDLTVPRPCFVTLKRNGDLRGCIGNIIAGPPLAQAVSQMALAAAFRDTRFSPLTREEVEGLKIEISVLSPIAHVTDLNDIQVGRDGLIMESGYNRGLLLPQVPVEQGWNKDEFLDYTCRKAGLEPKCWQEKVKIFKFSALVFGERRF